MTINLLAVKRHVALFLFTGTIACGSLLEAQEQSAKVIEETQLRSAVEKALPLIEEASAGSAENRKCFMCHGQALPVMAITEAHSRGFEIDLENLKRQVEHTAAHLNRGKKGYLEGKGQGGQVDTAGYALWTLEAGERSPDEVTAAVVEYLLQRDLDAGRWTRSGNRPPSEASDFTATYLALRALSVFASEEQEERASKRRETATQWLLEHDVTDTEDRVFRLRSSNYVAIDDEIRTRWAEELKEAQRKDGGWAQKDDMESDPYATATALVGLARTGFLDPEGDAYRRGLLYLIDSQKDDGSWHVVSRSKPFQKYFESGFPHEKDQFISTSASAWSAIALLLAIPESDGSSEQKSAGE